MTANFKMRLPYTYINAFFRCYACPGKYGTRYNFDKLEFYSQKDLIQLWCPKGHPLVIGEPKDD